MNETERNNKARMRYQNRGIFANPDNPRKIHLNEFSHRLVPSLAFYILSIFSGFVCGFAFYTGSYPILLFALVLSPFFGPFFGITLGITSGNLSFLCKSIGKYWLALLLFFLSACGIGGLGRFNNQFSAKMAEQIIQLNPWLLTITGASAFLVILTLLRNKDQQPQGFNIGAMAGVLIPLGLGGFSIGIAQLNLLAPALQTSALYGLTGLTGALLALLIQRVFIPKFSSFLASGIVLTAFALFITSFTTGAEIDLMQKIEPVKEQIELWIHPPSATPSPSPSVSPTPTSTTTPTRTATATPTQTATETPLATNTSAATATNTPLPPTATATGTATNTATATATKVSTATRTLRPSATPTQTFTPAPDKVYAVISVSTDVGVLMRSSPDFSSNVMKTLNNGTMVEVVDEQAIKEQVRWQRIRANDGSEGWVTSTALKIQPNTP